MTYTQNFERFVKEFSTLITPLTEIMKKSVGFKWEEEQERAFNSLEVKLINAPLLVFPNFTKSFEIESDALGISIEVVLMQEGHTIAYFSEKLSGSTLNYPTYNKELYSLHLKGQGKLNKRHAKWLEFIGMYVFLLTLYAKLLGFEYVKELYVIDPHFAHIYVSCEKGVHNEFYMHDGFLFKGNKFCVPKSSLCELLVRVTHRGGLMGHFGIKKT
ncbi:Retrovirus-related Pol polyprotein from transposon 17.6, partial [Mucuna pruriens]